MSLVCLAPEGWPAVDMNLGQVDVLRSVLIRTSLGSCKSGVSWIRYSGKARRSCGRSCGGFARRRRRLDHPRPASTAGARLTGPARVAGLVATGRPCRLGCRVRPGSPEHCSSGSWPTASAWPCSLWHCGTSARRAPALTSRGHPSSAPRSRRWLGEPVTPGLLVAGALMAVGVWLHLTEQHAHVHAHPAEEHDHEHEHDVHHHHEHAEGHVVERHSHPHRQEPMTHAHAHFPDAHHRHSQ